MAAARRLGRYLLAAALLVGACWVVSKHVGDYDTAYRPLTASAAVGHAADTGSFTVRVDKVVAARSIREAAYGSAAHRLGTPGVFLVVTASIRASTSGQPLKTAFVKTADGRQYYPTDKTTSDDNLLHLIAQPGYWTTGQAAFEIPQAKLAGARLEIANRLPNQVTVPSKVFPPWGFELTPQADIDLGIDQARARSMIASAKQDVPIGRKPNG